MKRLAIVLTALASACATALEPNPADPVDMAADLGNRARHYVGMGEACDAAAADGYRASIVAIVEKQQERLGVLADLVNRAYRGRATEDLIQHMQTQMSTHQISASAFCDEVVVQAATDLDARATHVLTLTPQHDIMYYVREGQRPNT
jgi:uncharacterized protein YijF (DUF1287 family)